MVLRYEITNFFKARSEELVKSVRVNLSSFVLNSGNMRIRKLKETERNKLHYTKLRVLGKGRLA